MANLKLKNLVLLIVFLLSLLSTNTAQDEQSIKVNTYLVNIPIIASDRNERNISGLKKENFSIIQDGVKQEVAFFADEEAPMNVAILIDTSISTQNVIGDIKEAAREFVKIFRSEDQGMIVSFDYKMKLLSDFTSDQKKLSKAINRASISNGIGSNMQDIMYQLVTKDFASVKGRKAIIVLTDGHVGGHISNQILLNTLAEYDVLVYPILFKPLKPPIEVVGKEQRKKIEDYYNKQWLFINSVADVTGGRLYPNGPKNFKKIFQIIADELKKQYLIGFYPQDVETGRQTVITVNVNPDDIVIRSKNRIRLRISN